MRFSGHWVATEGTTIHVTPDEFDETDLSAASNWKNAHQNEDPALPHGFIDPERVVAEVASRWLRLHPEAVKELADCDSVPMEVRTLEDLGRLCLQLMAEMDG